MVFSHGCTFCQDGANTPSLGRNHSAAGSPTCSNASLALAVRCVQGMHVRAGQLQRLPGRWGPSGTESEPGSNARRCHVQGIISDGDSVTKKLTGCRRSRPKSEARRGNTARLCCTWPRRIGLSSSSKSGWTVFLMLQWQRVEVRSNPALEEETEFRFGAGVLGANVSMSFNVDCLS